MAATREQLTALYENIGDLDSQKAALSLSIKDAFTQFAEEKQVNIKALKKSYRNWVEAHKNREEFLVVEAATDELTDISLALTTEG